ncbi:hypothetical protein DMUE_3170 [Dictyocoela muelleri]|nr:hypothetical protein DMUE_3170 [Dictyocoela muelleri]
MADRARYILNNLLEKNKNEKYMKNEDTCIYKQIEFCPYQAFQGTRFNLGNCPFKNHLDDKNINDKKNNEKKINDKKNNNDKNINNDNDNKNNHEMDEIHERQYLDLLTEIYINIKLLEYKNIKRIEDFKIKNDKKLNEIKDPEILLLENQFDDYLCNVEKFLNYNIEEAFECYTSAEKILIELEKKLHLKNASGNFYGMKICICGAIISKFADNSHFNGKYHKSVVMVINTMASLIRKYKLGDNF